MADKYEVTMMYRVQLPEGTETVLAKEFKDHPDLSVILTELISEAMHDYHNTTATGLHYSNWVYLGEDRAEGEMWSAGWYNLEALPGEWEGTTEKQLRNWLTHKYNRFVRVLLMNVAVSNMSWVWEQEEG
jgi:hypothetical protein